MSTMDSGLLREAIRKKLAMCAGRDPDAQAVAKAVLRTWRLVAARLAPVIGERGVDVLFSRSLHLTSTSFPWLVIPGDNGDSADPLANFIARLDAQETTVAAEAGYALLVTFTELLATLIGEPLTERLLKQVWVPPSSTFEQETAS